MGGLHCSRARRTRVRASSRGGVTVRSHGLGVAGTCPSHARCTRTDAQTRASARSRARMHEGDHLRAPSSAGSLVAGVLQPEASLPGGGNTTLEFGRGWKMKRVRAKLCACEASCARDALPLTPYPTPAPQTTAPRHSLPAKAFSIGGKKPSRAHATPKCPCARTHRPRGATTNDFACAGATRTRIKTTGACKSSAAGPTKAFHTASATGKNMFHSPEPRSSLQAIVLLAKAKRWQARWKYPKKKRERKSTTKNLDCYDITSIS